MPGSMGSPRCGDWNWMANGEAKQERRCKSKQSPALELCEGFVLALFMC